MIEKVYMVCCEGMLGRDFGDIFANNNIKVLASDNYISEDWLAYGDVSFKKYIKNSILDFKPDVIIILADIPALEFCEENRYDSFQSNYEGAKNFVDLSSVQKVPYVYIATIGVFDGKKEYYDETDTSNPLIIYVKTKYKTKVYVLENIK